MAKYLITGFKGQLGYDIYRELKKRGIDDIAATDKDEMDITNREEVMEFIKRENPSVIFHCAAWTAVDKAEEEKELCELVNVIGTRNIVDASIECGAKIFYMSTDYVFDGTKDGIYTEEDEVNPINFYGKTKYLGEEEVRRNPNHFITRISWVFGINGNNFVKTMIRLAENHDTLCVVDDQIGSPTYTVDLARLLVDMSETDKYGTYNATNSGYCSWADFAEYIFKVYGKDVKVKRVSTKEYSKGNNNQAPRPYNSRLSKALLEEIFNYYFPSWKDATSEYINGELVGKVLRR